MNRYFESESLCSWNTGSPRKTIKPISPDSNSYLESRSNQTRYLVIAYQEKQIYADFESWKDVRGFEFAMSR